MLVHDRLQRVDDPLLLLLVGADLLDAHAVADAGKVRGEQPGEHAITEVALDDAEVALVPLGGERQLDHDLIPVAALQAPCLGDEQVAVEHLHHSVGGLVLTSARGVDGDDRSFVLHPIAHDGGGAVIAVAVEADTLEILQPVLRVARPDHALGRGVHVEGGDDQV